MNSRILVVLCLIALLVAVSAQEPDAKEMVRKADLKLRGEKSSILFFNFVVIRPGQKISRQAISYLKGKPNSFIHFLKPLRDRDTTILKNDYDLWMYTPKVRKTVRIPVAMMHEGVLGSDFTYDDIVKAATFTDDYDPKIIGLSKAMEKEHGKVYVLDLTPLPGRPIAYKKLRLWIRPKDDIMLRVQYYNEKNQVTRVLQYSDVKEVGGRTIPTTQKMSDLTKKGHSTIIQILDAEFNTLEKSDMFTQRSLVNPPQPEFK